MTGFDQSYKYIYIYIYIYVYLEMTKLHLPAAALGWNTLERSVKVLLL